MWQDRLKVMHADRVKLAALRFQRPWVFGAPTMEAAMEEIRKFTLAGVAERSECPTLVLYEGDRLTSRAVAEQLYNAVGARDKTLKVFTAEEGGTGHGRADNRQVGIDFIGDRLAKRLMAQRPAHPAG